VSSLLFVYLFLFVDPFSADILQEAKDVWASHDALIDLFERIQFFLKRLDAHTQISPTKDVVEILVKIVAEIISLLSIATKEMQRSRATTNFKTLSGRKDIEGALTRLDSLTQEVWIAITQALNRLKDNAKKASEAVQPSDLDKKGRSKTPSRGRSTKRGLPRASLVAADPRSVS